MLGLVLAGLADAMNAAAASVAAPELAGHLSASADEAGWLGVTYTAGRMFAFLVAPYLIQRFGLYASLAGSLGLLIGQSAVLMGEPTLPLGFVCRAVQGLAGGCVTVTALAAMLLGVPRIYHGWAQAALGITTQLGPALGAVLTGAISDTYGWRMGFAWDVPFAGVALLCLTCTLRHQQKALGQPPKLDGTSLMLWGIGVLGSQFIVARGVRYNWDDVTWLLPLVALSVLCLLGLAAWTWAGHRRKLPRLVSAAPLYRREFIFACFTALLSSYGSTGSAMLLPLYSRNIFGFASADVGALQLVSVGAILIGLFLSAACAQWRLFPPTWAIYGGMALFAGSLVLWSNATWQIDSEFLQEVMALRGLGFGLMTVPTAVVAFSRLDGVNLVYAAGIFQAARQLGTSIATLSLNWRLAEAKARFGYNIAMHISPTDPAVRLRLAEGAARLTERGMLHAQGGQAGMAEVRTAFAAQINILVYNACFLELVYIFLAGMCCMLMLRSRIVGP
jgi:DHA2 family multidrug resistance protein